MIQDGRPRESLVLFDNAIEVKHQNQPNNFAYALLFNYRLQAMLIQMTHLRNNSVVSKKLIIQHKQKNNCFSCRLEEKGSTATNGKQTKLGEYPECDPPPSWMVRKRQTLHLIRFSLISLSCRCGSPPRNARPKVDGAPSAWIGYLPRPWRTLQLVLRRDHQIGNTFRAWTWSASPTRTRWNSYDYCCVLNSLLVIGDFCYEEVVVGGAWES